MANTPEYFREQAANFVDENIGVLQGALIQTAATAQVNGPNSLITPDLAVRFRQAGQGVFARMAGFENPGQGGVRRGDIGDLGRDIGQLMLQNADMMTYGSSALGALANQTKIKKKVKLAIVNLLKFMKSLGINSILKIKISTLKG